MDNFVSVLSKYLSWGESSRYKNKQNNDTLIQKCVDYFLEHEADYIIKSHTKKYESFHMIIRDVYYKVLYATWLETFTKFVDDPSSANDESLIREMDTIENTIELDYAVNNRLDLLMLMHKYGLHSLLLWVINDFMFTYHVVRSGYISLLKWCIEKGYINIISSGNENIHRVKHLTWETPWYAVATGEVDMLEYLSNTCKLVPTDYDEAKLILSGIVETIKALDITKRCNLLAWLQRMSVVLNSSKILCLFNIFNIFTVS